jgi:hypothetical protein
VAYLKLNKNICRRNKSFRRRNKLKQRQKTQLKMNNKKTLLSAFFVILSFYVAGQSNAFHQHSLPKMLESYPDSINISMAEFEELFRAESRNPITLTSGNSKSIELSYINKTTWEDNSVTVAYRVVNLPDGTILNINKVIYKGAWEYRAHIVNHKYADAYKLITNNTQRFVFRKIDTEQVVAE